MDAIRKKMKSLKSETDQLNKVIRGFEEETRDYNHRAEQVRHSSCVSYFNSTSTLHIVSTL